MLHDPGNGFRIAMRALDSGRIGISAQALEIAVATFENTVAYAKERHQFGHSIARLKLTLLLADVATRIEAPAT
jgi:alkylation response protein AidB-like acyl-CoA dehydrogenase